MERKTKKSKGKRAIVDFATLINLPERLTQYLRLWFHVSKSDWDFMVDKIRQGKPYTEWSKSKGRGKGRRYFAAPCNELKKVQKSILNQFLSQIPVHFSRHGGVRGSSILTNADHHVGFAKTVFAVDIINAFPSIFRSRVRACLRKPMMFGLRQFAGVTFTDQDQKMLLEAIVDLLVWKDRLPQGPPTSPRVFEIVCGKTDKSIFELVTRNSTAFQSYRLSIYADNITISSDDDIPVEFRDEVLAIIKKNGFLTHTRKDKMQYFSPETGTVPVVTGLVITDDSRLLMHPTKVNQLRGKLGRLLKQEIWDTSQHGEVSGILGYIRQVYPVGKKVPSKLRKVVANVEARLQKPLALTETRESAPTAKNVRPLKITKSKKSRKNKTAPKRSGKKARTRELVFAA